MWHCPWIMQNLFENQLIIQKACWRYTKIQTCNLFVLLSENFAGSCLKVFKSYDNFSIPGVHNICIILYVYDMRDSSAVARGGGARFTKTKQPKPWGGCSHLVNNVAGPDENMKNWYLINNLVLSIMLYFLFYKDQTSKTLGRLLTPCEKCDWARWKHENGYFVNNLLLSIIL